MSQLIHLRECAGKSAILFIHGFTGDPKTTWANFPQHLAGESSLSNWNILTLGYPSSLLPGTRGIWSADPDLPILSTSLFTELQIVPLLGYADIAIVAHSMGGLIAQRALLNDPKLTAKIRHLFLFGTPSAGISKASFLRSLFGKLVNDEVDNMAAGSPFILNLRAEWTTTFGDTPPFQFLAIAGEKDNFVPPSSSLEPFPKNYRRVVAGDHASMVKPGAPSADVVRLLISSLNQSAEPAGPSSPLRMAAELGNAAPEGMAIAHAAAAGKAQLKESEVVEAALALDRAGLWSDAVKVLENNKSLGTDVIGTLAGRIKRRWIQEGETADAQRALGLYSEALATARAVTPETPETICQIFYHAINVAFLQEVAFGQTAAARTTAGLALMYAQKAQPPDVWSVATEAEAWLYLGDEQKALDKYRQVIAMSPEKWKLMSTGQQAQQIAAKLGKPQLQEQLRHMFEPEPPATTRAASTRP